MGKALIKRAFLAARKGFEPPEHYKCSADYQSTAISHSATSDQAFALAEIASVIIIGCCIPIHHKDLKK